MEFLKKIKQSTNGEAVCLKVNNIKALECVRKMFGEEKNLKSIDLLQPTCQDFHVIFD